MNTVNTAPAPEALAEILRRSDHFRVGAGPRAGGGIEWQHFIVHAGALSLLVNFSVARASARLIVLAHDGRTWRGGVEHVPGDMLDVEPGEVDARFGDSRLRLVGDTYHVSFAPADASLRGELALRAAAMPALSQNIALTAERRIHWLLVPRLQADGWIELDGRRTTIRSAPAYHDHNWGDFRWGDDFAWEWGSGLPRDVASPWSLVFVRMADRARHRVRSQGLMLWRDGQHFRFFRDDELTVTHRGAARFDAVFKLPPVLALLVPGAHTDIPAEVVVTATRGADSLELRLVPRRLAQVLVPDERHPRRVVVLNEALAELELHGRAGGRNITMEGDGVFEFMRG